MSIWDIYLHTKFVGPFQREEMNITIEKKSAEILFAISRLEP